MGNKNDKQSIAVWDSTTLKDADAKLMVQVSKQEWQAIKSKLEEKLFNLPDTYLKQQDDTAIQESLANLLKELCPELAQKASLVLEKMDSGYRFCILKGFRFTELDEKSSKLLMLGFSCLVGSPTATDKVTKTVLWPVRPEKLHTVENTTFSQRTGEAAYHTDTQYFENPEKYMSLWCLNPDRNGGGKSGLLDGRKVIEEIKKRYGNDVTQTLSDITYPFRVPSVFTAQGNDAQTEVYYGSILNTTNKTKPLIRYRKETLDKGMSAGATNLDEQHRHAGLPL